MSRFLSYVRRHHIALLALFVAMGGTSYAAFKLPKNSVGSKQIKANAVNSSKVANGSLRPSDFATAKLPTGPQGPQGATGSAGKDGVVRTVTWSGPIPNPIAASSHWQFLGPTATVTTTADQRLSGSAMVPIGNSSTAVVLLDLCFQPTTGGALHNFSGNPSVVVASTARVAQADVGSVVPGAGSWKVGACFVSSSLFAPPSLDSNSNVNGYMQVTN